MLKSARDDMLTDIFVKLPIPHVIYRAACPTHDERTDAKYRDVGQ